MSKGSKTNRSKSRRKVCPVLNDDVAHWMLPDSISVRDGGSCNVLVVVPYGYPGEDNNAELLGALIAENMDCYAVINNRMIYRQGLKDRPKKTRADLGDYEDAFKFMDYWLPIEMIISGISNEYKSPAIVIFIHAMEDFSADQFEEGLMFAVGKGFIGQYNSDKATGSESFFADLMSLFGDDELTTMEFEEYCQPCLLPLQIRKRYKHDVEAVTISIRCEGYRDTIHNIQNTSNFLSRAITRLSFFKNTDDLEPIYFSDIQEDGSASRTFVTEYGGKEYTTYLPNTLETKEDKLADVSNTEKNEDSELEKGLFEDVNSEEIIEARISTLRAKKTITTDTGDSINFSGKIRESFLDDVRKGYPIVTAMVQNIYDSGQFLFNVRERQKKNKLWIAYLEAISLPRRTAHNYIQAYEKLGSNMGKYAYLGVTKLLTVSRIKEPVKYLEENADKIALENTIEVQERIKNETKRNLSGQKRKKPKETVEDLGYQSIKATLSPNGRILKITNLNQDIQKELIKLLKSHFSKRK